MTKVYQEWKGSNIFCCWGLFIFGPDVKTLVLSVFLILVPGVLFCVFVAYPCIGKFPGAVAILPVYICLLLWNLFILLYTACRDPGIVPRSLTPPEGEDEELENGHTFRRIPRSKEVLVNGLPVRIKYCATCQLFRPPRCSHCSVCDNCVERFDHHCPWVGQCIGKRNYSSFYLFISTTTAHCILVIVLSVLYLLALHNNFYTPNGQPRSAVATFGSGPVAVGLTVFCFVAIWFVGGLTAFHSYLVATNQTTYENFRNRFDKKSNPFNRGVLRNVAEVLCGKIPPSKANFRAEVAAAESQEAETNADEALAAALRDAESHTVEVKEQQPQEAELALGLVASQKNGSLFVPENLTSSDKGEEGASEPRSEVLGTPTPRSRRQLVRGVSDNTGSPAKKSMSPTDDQNNASALKAGFLTPER